MNTVLLTIGIILIKLCVWIGLGYLNIFIYYGLGGSCFSPKFMQFLLCSGPIGTITVFIMIIVSLIIKLFEKK